MNGGRELGPCCLSKGDRAAVEAVKFCLLNGTTPFRIDIEILLRLVDAVYETRGGPRVLIK